MTCYLRHLNPILKQAEVMPTNKNQRRQVDEAVRAIVGIDEPGIKCPQIWQQVKIYLQEPGHEEELIQGLKDRLGQK